MVAVLLAATFAFWGCSNKAQKRELPSQQFAKAFPETKPISNPRVRAFLAQKEALASEVAVLLEKEEIPGAAAAVVLDGEVVFSQGFGFSSIATKEKLNSKSVLRIGSVTKVFTALALLQLRDEGRIRLDDPVATVVPEISGVLYPTQDSPRITFRHLMTHSSGIPRVGKLDYYSDPSKEVTAQDVTDALQGTSLGFSPGTKSEYSNLAVALAGVAIARLHRKSYQTAVRDVILKPLGMNNSYWAEDEIPKGMLATGYEKGEKGFAPKPHWNMGAAAAMGAMYSNLDDMTAFVRWQLSAWPPSNGAEGGPVRRSTIRESHLPLGHGTLAGNVFGGNWVVMNHDEQGHLISHTGSTHQYSATVRMWPEMGLGLVVLSNTGHPASSKIGQLIQKRTLAAIPKKSVPVLETLENASKRLVKLLNSPNKDGIEALFSPAMRKAISPDKLFLMFSNMKENLGECSLKDLEQEGTNKGHFLWHCSNASLMVHLSIEGNSPVLINSLRIKPAKE